MTRPDDISEAAWHEAGKIAAGNHGTSQLQIYIARAIQKAVYAEREECAQIADDADFNVTYKHRTICLADLATTIRQRGKR